MAYRDLFARCILTIFLNISIVVFAYSQITIAPTNLFIDSQTRFGSYLVINNSQSEQEVSIDFLFGYSVTDSLGNRRYVYDDSVKAESYSVTDWVRAFPQNFVIQPNQRQVVRLRINAPNDIEDRTYFSRIRTSSTNLAPPVELDSDNSVSANIDVTINQISGLFYKKGSVNTGIEVERMWVRTNDDQLIALGDINRTGNSPFIGTITTSLIDKAGNVIDEAFTSTTIHFDMIHRQNFNLNEIPSGQYTLRMHFESQRSDISQSDIIQMEPVTATTTVTIP